MNPNEQILVVKRDIVFKNGVWQGLKTDNLDYYLGLIKDNFEFQRRGDVEENPYFQQIIPYILFNFENKYFLYRYLEKAGEQRLKNDYMLGIGGHINKIDNNGESILRSGTMREWEEEVDYRDDFIEQKLVGMLNDDSRPVEAVHLGLVFVFRGKTANISIKEKETIRGRLVEYNDLPLFLEKSQGWAPIVWRDYLSKLKNKDRRRDWDYTGAQITKVFSQRSHCIKYKVGAAFFRDKQLVGVGYNGPPKGQPHCDEVGCAKEVNRKMLAAGSGLCRGAHAEMNAIVNAAYNGISLKDTKLFCTFSPCYDCAKHLVNLGIKEVVFQKKYEQAEGERALKLLKSAGMLVRQTDLL